ncbi:MAG TPA: thioredoxin family protein [Verrucomicrobiae bacterium]|nr:thioredoxin family protein [Verrucomicrobiae bacterium]
MKKIALGVMFGWLAFQVAAAEGEWMTDLAKAQEKAKTEKKMVLVDFTGSDWCPPCRALHKNVFSSEEFAEFAKKNLVLVEIDFPRKKEQSEQLKKTNRELAKKHEIDGYPTVIVFDSEGKQLDKKVGYSGAGAKEYVGQLQKIKDKS